MENLFKVIYDPNILVADGASAITNGFKNVFRDSNFIRAMCWVHMLRNVEKRLNGDLFKWTCPFYQKHYSCSHIISVSTSLNLVKLPAHCKNMIQIGEKTKRGRKPKALKALQTQ